MKVAKTSTEEEHNGPTCTIHKYTFPSDQLGFVTAEVRGRYPASNDHAVINQKCDETYYVLQGACTVHHQDAEECTLEEGDVFFFPKMQWYWIEADDAVTLCVCTAPPWTPEQHQNVKLT